MKYLLAIDPGLATGMSLFDITDPMEPILIEYQEMSLLDFYVRIPQIFGEYGENLQVVCEDFLITMATAKKTQAPWSLNLIGVLQYFCWKYNVEMTMQKPTERMFADNDKIKALGFKFKKGAGHVTESVRHAIVWMVRREKNLPKKFL